MENTLENKAKFFAQYWGQKVWFRNDRDLGDKRGIVGDMSQIERFTLELTPLSDITDEDAIEVCKCMKWDRVLPPNIEGHPLDFSVSISDFNWIKNKLFDWSKINLHTADFLRSKGYALPWMGLSVEKQSIYGWVKLKNIKDEDLQIEK